MIFHSVLGSGVCHFHFLGDYVGGGGGGRDKITMGGAGRGEI